MKIQARLGSCLGDQVQGRKLWTPFRDILQLESVVRDLIELARPGELRQPMSMDVVVDDAAATVGAASTARSRWTRDARGCRS
jgi:hypothetical protein